MRCVRHNMEHVTSSPHKSVTPALFIVPPPSRPHTSRLNLRVLISPPRPTGVGRLFSLTVPNLKGNLSKGWKFVISGTIIELARVARKDPEMISLMLSMCSGRGVSQMPLSRCVRVWGVTNKPVDLHSVIYFLLPFYILGCTPLAHHEPSPLYRVFL